MIKAYSKSLREFVLKGDPIAIGAALLVALVIFYFLQTLVEGMIAPLIAALFDEPNLHRLHFTVNGNEISYGSVLVALILVALAFAVVVGVSKIYKGAAGHSDET